MGASTEDAKGGKFMPRTTATLFLILVLAPACTKGPVAATESDTGTDTDTTGESSGAMTESTSGVTTGAMTGAMTEAMTGGFRDGVRAAFGLS